MAKTTKKSKPKKASPKKNTVKRPTKKSQQVGFKG
jgi:hypothetical protein